MYDAVELRCALKPDCPRANPFTYLVGKYDARIPRYTSYPTAVQFTSKVEPANYVDWLSRIAPSRSISLYIHIPFCERLCWYCGCNTGVAHKRSPIVDYIETLEREIGLTTAAIPHRPVVTALHLGGGSPNSLSPGDLERLMAHLKRHFDFASDATIAAELDPRSLTEDWVGAAANIGLNRASLGVQDLDPKVQAAINRHQPFAMVEWSANALRQAGVKSINLDLVYGLPRQTAAGLTETIDRILNLDPDRIAFFGYAHVPWMMPRQKLIKEHELPDAVERFYQQSAAAQRIEDAGYIRIGLDHFALPADSLAIAARNGTLRRNFQGYSSDQAATLIGFGASSISSLDHGFAQNHPDVRSWRGKINSGRLAVARGVELSDDDRFCGEIIQNLMCNLEVDLDLSCRKWGVNTLWLADKLEHLRSMELDGLVKIRGSLIKVTDSGRPFLRAVCAVFDNYLAARTSAPRHSRMI